MTFDIDSMPRLTKLEIIFLRDILVQIHDDPDNAGEAMPEIEEGIYLLECLL